MLPDSYSDEITRVVSEIVQLIAPKKIILFSQKTDIGGQLSAFKLCVIYEGDDSQKEEIEKNIYLHVESDAPFDIVAYSTGRFNCCQDQKDSFAHKILNTGVVIYE